MRDYLHEVHINEFIYWKFINFLIKLSSWEKVNSLFVQSLVNRLLNLGGIKRRKNSLEK